MTIIFRLLEDLSISLTEGSEEEEDGSKAGLFRIKGMICGKEMDLEVHLLQFLVTLDTASSFKNPVVLEKEKAVLAGSDILRFAIQCDLDS